MIEYGAYITSCFQYSCQEKLHHLREIRIRPRLPSLGLPSSSSFQPCYLKKLTFHVEIGNVQVIPQSKVHKSTILLTKMK